MVDLENIIIVIKSVPAKVCISCGEQYFNGGVTKNIEKIKTWIKKVELISF